VGRGRKESQKYPRVILSHSGLEAVIEPDVFVPGSYLLVVDGTPQSHVNIHDPRSLFFEYVQRMGHIIDLIKTPGEKLTAVHLGAGAFTLPRYIEATRPGSTQHVVELETDLINLVRAELPLPKNARIRVRHGDAREVLTKLPAGLVGNVDLIVVDIFSGARIPAHVTSQEFYARITPLLSPHGIVLVNVIDGPGHTFVRSEAATITSVFAHTIALAETQVLKARRFGNIVFAASQHPLNPDWISRLAGAGPHPAKLLDGDEFEAFTAGAAIITDATAAPSPAPSQTLFHLRDRVPFN
jgi:spermidine synthase